MDPFSNAMADGGPVMLLIMGSMVLSVLWSMVLALAGMFRLRVPALLYWGPAVFIICLGALGSLWGQHQALQAMANVEPNMQGPLMAAGHAASLLSRMAGHYAGMVCFFTVALCAAFAAVVRPGEAAKMSWGSALGSGTLLGLGGFVLAFVSWMVDAGPMGFLLALSISFIGGFTAFIGGLRTSMVTEDADRMGELRLTVAGSLVGAVVCGGYGIVDQGSVDTYNAISMASPESMQVLMAAGDSLSGGGWWLMGLGLPLMAMALSFMVRPSTGRLMDSRGSFSVMATTAGWVCWFLLLAAFSWRAVGYLEVIGA